MGIYETMSAIPGISLRGYYKCDETAGTVAEDSHTSGIDAEIIGTLGRHGTGLSPASTRSFGGGGGLKIPGRMNWGGGFTLAMLFRCDNSDGSSQTLWCNGGDGGGSAHILNGNGDTSGQVWYLEHGVGWSAQGFYIDENTHTLILQYNTNTLLRVYIDSVEVLSQFRSAPSNQGTDFFSVGSQTDSGWPLDGRFDEVFVYDGAIDPTHVTAMHNALLEPLPDPDADPYETLYSGIRYRHNPTGTIPYSLRDNPAPNADEHYDTPGCMLNARDVMVHFGQTPSNWDLNIDIALEMWRDKWVIAAGGGVAGYHRHSHGIARHAEETGDPDSVAAALMISPMYSRDNNGLYAHPDNIAFWRARTGYPYNTREQAFELMSMVDASRAGHPKHGLSETWVEVAIEFIDHVCSPPEVRFGAYTWGFMIALTARALLNYWFFYRDSPEAPIQAARATIPPAIETLCAHIYANCWWAPGPSRPIAFTGDTWNKGSLKYVWPRGDTPSHQPLGPYTIASVANNKTVFTGPPELSAVDDFYKFSYISHPGVTEGHFWVKSYDGATKTFTMERTFVPDGMTLTVGDTFSIVPEGGGIAGGGVAPDDGMPFANTMICPIYSWMAWYYTHEDTDPVKAAANLAIYHEMFNGGSLMWGNPWMQKEWNECMYHIASGIGWQIAADEGTDTTFDSLSAAAEPVEVETYSLSGPSSGEVGAASTNFTVTLGSGTVSGTIRVTPASTAGAGTFNPTFLDLTQVTRSGTFTYTPGDAGERTINVTDDAGLTDPAGVVYTATEAPVEVETYTLVGPATGLVDAASGAFTVTLGSGAVEVPIRFVPQSSAGSGTFNPTFLDLDDDTRSGTFTYTPTTAGARTISVNDNAGLTDPAGVSYTATEPIVAVLGLTAPVPSSGPSGVASGAFAVEITGPVAGTVRVTPAVVGGATGIFIPSFLDLSDGLRSGTFVFVPSGAGLRTIGVANNGGIAAPPSVPYTATAPPEPPPKPADDSPRIGKAIAIQSEGGSPTWLISK